MRESTTAAIIAGGRARRFSGQDKSRLVVEGRTIIVRQVEILQRVAEKIIVVGPASGRFDDLGLAVHEDRVPDAGVIGGIYTALAVADPGLVIAVGCDLPFLHAGLLARLVELTGAHDGAWVRTARGAEPLLACYRTTSQTRVLECIRSGRLKAAALDTVLDIAAIGPDVLETFGPVERLLANVNTPEDYARVQYGSS
jgi:molybdopterin-guanine dinucleotide biosynthesis protein A